MWRFLIFLGIAAYIIYKLGSFFFKIGAVSQQMRDRSRGAAPDHEPRKPKSGKIKGGDYVDYEEIK